MVSDATPDERVTKLEKLMDELVRHADTSRRKKDWRRTAGMFEGDPVMKEIIEEGRHIREMDRRQAGV
jgi:hypothetical protein